MRSYLCLSLFALSALAATAADDSGPRLLEYTRQKPGSATRADIRVNVDMTLVPVTVLDSYGRNVLGLSREHFRVFDGSTRVPIESFSVQDAPVSVGLIFDCSRSMTEKYKTARGAPAELYNRLNTQDESFLITVSDRAELRQPFTSEFAQIQNSLLFVHPAGTTSLLDGVYLGLAQLKKAHNPKKALIIVSDGGENNSRYNLREILASAVESDTQIFAIGLFDHPQTAEEREGPQTLASLSGKTGGLTLVVGNVDQLRDAMAKIGTVLHNQYVLGYYPPPDSHDGKFHRIKVQLTVPASLPPLRIFARAGYYSHR